MENLKIKYDTIIRTVVLFITLLNQIFIFTGKEIFPFSEEQIYQTASIVATVVAALWAWWKNNSFTLNAIRADKVLKDLKDEKNMNLFMEGYKSGYRDGYKAAMSDLKTMMMGKMPPEIKQQMEEGAEPGPWIWPW